MTYTDYLQTPIGLLQLIANELGLTAIDLVKEEEQDINSSGVLDQTKKELSLYFDGKLTSFSIPLNVSYGTIFFQSVWEIVYNIPYGKTLSYLDIARKLDNLGAIRAVGMANARNPIPIIIPCHRVIGTDGSLTGYALGLEIKRKLLMLENPQIFGMQGSLAI